MTVRSGVLPEQYQRLSDWSAAMAANYAYSNTADSPWISGTPHGLHSANIDAHTFLAAAVATVLVEGRSALAADIKVDQAWMPYADQVTLTWTGSEFSYNFTGTEEQIEAMERLEYGDSNQSATNLLSKSMFRLDKRVAAAVDEAVSEAIGLG